MRNLQKNKQSAFNVKNALIKMVGPIILILTLGNIAGPTGTTQNIGGATGRIRWSPVSSFTTIEKKAELSDSPAPTNLALINISEDHVWAATKGAYEMYITRDTGDVKFTMNQDRDTTGCEIKFEAITPGAEAATEAILVQISNDRNIFWIELADGKWVQVGSERFPAEFKYEWNSEKNGKGERGWKVMITGFESTKQYYTGAFTFPS